MNRLRLAVLLTFAPFYFFHFVSLTQITSISVFEHLEKRYKKTDQLLSLYTTDLIGGRTLKVNKKVMEYNDDEIIHRKSRVCPREGGRKRPPVRVRSIEHGLWFDMNSPLGLGQTRQLLRWGRDLRVIREGSESDRSTSIPRLGWRSPEWTRSVRIKARPRALQRVRRVFLK